jgi:hypothetical protein
VISFLQVFLKIFVHTSIPFHACYVLCPSHPPGFDYPIIWWEVEIMKILIMQFSPVSCRLSDKALPVWMLLQPSVLILFPLRQQVSLFCWPSKVSTPEDITGHEKQHHRQACDGTSVTHINLIHSLERISMKEEEKKNFSKYANKL